jgi:tetratricopeptide (TPR) repeat protein
LKAKAFSLFSVPRASFISVLVLIVVLIGVVSLGFLFVQRAIAQVYFGEALVAGNNNQIDNAENYLNKAVAIQPFDSFYRALSNVSMARLSTLLQDQNATASSVQTGFQNLLSSAIQNAQLATQANAHDYQNWLALAQVYASVVPKPFQIKDAYQSAKNAFNKAEALNPSSPSILLSMARLESDNGSLDAAATLANNATNLKSDYADAHFFLSQIAVQQGDLQTAISKTQTTILLTPQNAGLYFQLGVLYFNVPDYQKAAQALAQAVQILPDYANARYFLGLSLARTGDKAGAIAQFQAIQSTNPDNTEVVKVLANLQAGKDPLAGIAGAAQQPTQRQTLPVTGQ